MKMNSVVVGIQYHKGVEALNKGDEVELVFNKETDEFPNGIRVLNNNGVLVGNIISNMNHPSLDNDVIISNNIKNNNAIRKVTTDNCKATVVAIKRYVVFITINTTISTENNNNGDENMDLKERIKELEENIEENKKQNRKLRKERVAMKKELKQLKAQLEKVEEVEINTNEVVEETTDVEEEKGENMEEKIAKINKETIMQSVMERNIKPMAIELMQDGLSEAFDKAKEEYPIEVMAYTTKYIDLHPVANILLTIRSIDDIVAQRYLKGEVSGAEFDHMRAWIGIHSYFYYEHIIEEVNMEEFFTETSLKASEKFMKEEEERKREYRDDNDEDCGDNTTSSSSINNNDDDCDNDNGDDKMIERTYVREIEGEKDIDELDEATWSIFTQCDEIGAKGYFSDNQYFVEAYYENMYHCEVCEKRLKELGFEEIDPSQPIIEFVKYDGDYPNLCSGNLIITVNCLRYMIKKYSLISGGSVWFDDNWSEHVEHGLWTIREDALPDELKIHKEKIEKVINENIPKGCCGGCV